MLISMDHDCTPDCPICIPEEDLSKFVKERKIVPQSTPINHAMWLLYISYAFLTIALVGDAFWVASAIFGQDHQSHVASGRLTGGQSSIGLAERLELIEHLLKDIRLLPGESMNIMTAKEAGTSAIDDPNPGPSPSHDNLESPPAASSSEKKLDDPNPGPSPSHDNLESPPAASSSEKKPDAHARHPTGKDALLHLIMGSLIITWLAVGGRVSYLFEVDPDNSGRDSASELLGAGIRNVPSEEGTSNSDEETVTAIQEPVISQLCAALPTNESSSSQERMTSSSIETAGFPHEVEININISAQRHASSTLGGFSISKVSLSDNLDTTESLHSEDDEKNVQSDEVDYESRRDEENRAATMVQARFRGHLVRMSRPLAQLREIAEIENRVKKLNELAEDSAFLHLIRNEILAKLAVVEETMKLLLRLDNIQGSHPLVRQIRKLVAPEIVSLQETFDALLYLEEHQH